MVNIVYISCCQAKPLHARSWIVYSDRSTKALSRFTLERKYLTKKVKKSENNA